MKTLNTALLALLTSLLLSACTPATESYRNATPEFALEEFFNGPLVAYGMIQDRSGTVLRRFEATLEGTWEGNQGVLAEWFVYDDGERQERTWYLTKHSDGSYSGTASDVVGEARGTPQGFALNWRYTLQVPMDDDIWEFQLDDWMYLINERGLINRTAMKKFGIRVADLTLWIEKKPTE